MEPEIARRCSVCGASIRQRAFFCPQCGQSLSDERAQPDSHDAKTQNDAAVTGTEFESAKTIALDRSETEPLRASLPVPPEQKASATGAVRHRAGGAALAGFEEVRGRVEKIRKASSEVLDQAAYDPSVRFLLVAAASFVLFLILLILSKVVA